MTEHGGAPPSDGGNNAAAKGGMAANSCDFCGLPLVGALWSHEGGQAKPAYCCFGCRLAAEITHERGETGQRSWTLVRLGLAVFLSMNVMMFSMVLWTRDVYTPGGELAAATLDDLLRHLTLLLGLPVLWLLGLPLAEAAWQSLRQGRPGADLLIVGGVLAAYLYSAVSVFRGAGPVYVEVGCAVLVMVTLGRWLEATAKGKAHAVLDSLSRLLPETVCRLQGDDPTSRNQIPLCEVKIGDHLAVLAGERIAVDGQILRGKSLVDEQLLTGESTPRERGPGDAVVGGTLNLDGDLIMVASELPQAGALGRLKAAMQEARTCKGRYEQLADRTAAIFSPLVLLIALVAMATHAANSHFEAGLLSALAVVLIACPCALGVATPLAVWIALEAAAQRHILIRGGAALERLAKVRLVGFDKTGTLTCGQANLDRVICTDAAPDEVAARALALAGRSSHSLSRALWQSRQLRNQCGLQEFETRLAASQTVPGCGILGQFTDDASPTRLGSLSWLRTEGLVASPQLADAAATAIERGQPLVAIGWNGRICGLFTFQEQLRAEAAEAITMCRDLELGVQVLTGDHAGRGRHLAEELRIEVAAELTPIEKQRRIEQLQRAGRAVLMVGDGLNDAPALATADVGLAMGCGADVAREAADICLTGNDLRLVPWAVFLSRRTVRTMRQNLIWAFAYNAVGIVLAAMDKLNPVLAAIAMLASSVMVLANSLRLAQGIQGELHANSTAADGLSVLAQSMPRPGLQPADLTMRPVATGRSVQPT